MVIKYFYSEAQVYDFVLVGAGSASCLIASRLSQRLPGHRILVLEAGEHIKHDPKVQTPGLSSSLQSDPHYDWRYCSAPEPGLNDRQIKHPRGKLVGGTSCINSHSIVFPNYEWHDRIAAELLPASGQADWSAHGMRDCYERFHAESSWPAQAANTVGELAEAVKASYPREIDILQSQWMKAFGQLNQGTINTGFQESRAAGLTITNAVDASKGERSHAATAYMEPALERSNVTLHTGVMVDKILFDEKRTIDGKLNARGICYTYQGKKHSVKAAEIILCAGTFESPAVLERSGIGSEKVLHAAEVHVLYGLPGVGENLQDHLNCSLSREAKDNIPTHDEVIWDAEARKAVEDEYKQSRTGLLAEGAAYSFAFTALQMLERPEETRELLDLVRQRLDQESNAALRAQFSIIQKAIESPEEATATTFLIRSQRHRDQQSMPRDTPLFVKAKFVTLCAMLAHPFSRGSCHILSSGAQHPEIKFNYLSHPLDTEILARHMRLMERLFQQPALATVTKSNGQRLPRSYPYPIHSLDDGRKILPVSAATNYHPCGTCAMMREDLGGVVDERLIVYGTQNVRVCDASVLPIIPRGNILTAVYAFAEKAAEIICREAES